MEVMYGTIVSVTQGVAYMEEKEDGIHFHRFTKAQEQGYEGSEFHPKQYATAGVCLHFQTDSKKLYMKVLTSKGSSRNFFAHDILVDGQLIGSLCNKTENCYGEFENEFELGDGIKEVSIHFPWSVCSVLKELSIDDDSFIVPVKKDKKIIVFGDSISQGYDAIHPMNRYATNLANILKAEEINKAIGGEVFCPWLAELKDDEIPDYISVAYGTNHWHRSSPEEFRAACELFYGNLVANYPETKILALTPIWRKDHTDHTSFESFEQIGEIISDVVRKYQNVVCITGRNFIPEDESLFSDLYLHPNDMGFEHYSEGLRSTLEFLTLL